MSHTKDSAIKPLHGVFTADKSEVLGLVDEAWASRSAGTITKKGKVTEYVIPMGRQVGIEGGAAGSGAPLKSIKIVVEGTKDLITAFPVP